MRELDQRQRTRELDRTQALVGLRALARAIDAKDPATQEHSERVAALSARLAVARGWPPERVSLLRDAALLHDVGKIGVPDAILLKDGPLDDEEFAIVREHAVLGARIVGDVLDEEQIAWIAGHHERPDGSGYPGALGGDDVPEGAALLALADAWDVMVSDRSYSAPMTRRGRAGRGPGARGHAVRGSTAVEALESAGAARRPHAGGGAAAPADRLSRHGRGQRAVGVRAARGQEREQRQPVAALVEVEVGDQHGGLVARRLHELAPVGVGDERGAVEGQRRPRSRSG